MKIMRKTLMIIFLSILIINLSGTVQARIEPPGENIYSIYGYTKDIDTSAAINGATVKLYKVHNGIETYLDTETSSASGHFFFVYTSLTKLTFPDLFRIKITHPYYNSLTKSKPVQTSTNFGNVYLSNPVERYAVLIGVGTSESDGDVSDWKSALLDRGYPSANIKTLVSTAATKSQVRSEIQWLRDVADPNDKIVVTFNCHGEQESGNDGFLWMASDAKYYDNEFRDDIRSTSAASAFIFICACYSGTFLDEFSGYSKFYVATAAPSYGYTFGLTAISFTYVSPGTTNPYAGIQYDQGAWTHFFLKYIGESTLEDAFDMALNSVDNQGFRDWYAGTHYLFQVTGIQPVTGYWYTETWYWPSDGFPDGLYQKGWPQEINAGTHTL